MGGGNLKPAMEFFSKGSVSYTEFKQQCMSLRIFAFLGVTGACAFSLFWNPPKSSYWQRYSPSFWFSHIRSTFFPSSPPLFPTAKVEHDVNVPELIKELITTRRLPAS